MHSTAHRRKAGQRAGGGDHPHSGVPLGPLGFECSHHRPTARPSVERICRKALFSDLEDPALQCMRLAVREALLCSTEWGGASLLLCRRWGWRSNTSGKCSQERLTVTRTIRGAAHPSGCARCGAGAGCSAIEYRCYSKLRTRTAPRKVLRS